MNLVLPTFDLFLFKCSRQNFAGKQIQPFRVTRLDSLLLQRINLLYHELPKRFIQLFR